MGDAEHSGVMTISELLSITGAVAGVGVLVLMAAVPFLLALPLPDAGRAAGTSPGDTAPVAIPAQRTAADAPVHHRAAA